MVLKSRNRQGLPLITPKRPKLCYFCIISCTQSKHQLINIFMSVLSNETMEFVDSFAFLQDPATIIINAEHKDSWNTSGVTRLLVMHVRPVSHRFVHVVSTVLDNTALYQLSPRSYFNRNHFCPWKSRLYEVTFLYALLEILVLKSANSQVWLLNSH